MRCGRKPGFDSKNKRNKFKQRKLLDLKKAAVAWLAECGCGESDSETPSPVCAYFLLKN